MQSLIYDSDSISYEQVLSSDESILDDATSKWAPPTKPITKNETEAKIL